MSKRGKVTITEQIEAAKMCAEGKLSKTEAARRLGISEPLVEEWVHRYKINGPCAFMEQEHKAFYSIELKRQAVEEYTRGKGSQREISAKYGLRSSKQLREWIKVYNSGRDFGRKMSGGSRMKQGRETTQEERIAIVKDCLENGGNYEETAKRLSTSVRRFPGFLMLRP